MVPANTNTFFFFFVLSVIYIVCDVKARLFIDGQLWLEDFSLHVFDYCKNILL